MDLSPIANGLDKIAVSSQTLVMLAIVLVGTALFYVSTFGRKLREKIAETLFTNWRLGLLAATGLVLSLASGWTTWDGMRNFTQEPLLSLMITFGIQGVMLIVAWLIGESFATGMNYRPQTAGGPAGARRQGGGGGVLRPIAGALIGILLFVTIAFLILNRAGVEDALTADAAGRSWSILSDNMLFAAFAILLVAGILVMAAGDILSDYAQASKIILRSAVLWVMFLACMATSVFFSFDSLFSTIFPKEERARAAVLRAQNQIAGVVNDIAGLAARRRIEEQDALFRKEGWNTYEATLDQLMRVAREAPGELEAYFERKMRERQNVVAQRQEEKATAEGQQVRLSQRKAVLISEIGRVKEQVAPLASEVERFKSQVFAKDREIIAKKAEAEAEAGGIGDTSKVGRGPRYREIAAELRRLEEQKKNLQLQLREFEKRLAAARNQVAQNEAELRSIDGQLAQLAGRAQTADQLIQLAQQSRQTEMPQFDPTNGLRQLERARIAFRQNPSADGLTRLQSLCGTLVAAMTDVPTLKDKARSIDCDPGSAREAAGRVFALNTGVQLLAKNCVGGGKLPETGGADALFAFARGCVQDAGLPSTDTDRLRTRINTLELNRDDKAHRFVVTSNAFQDGNKLAYLALGIAIAIDALVFMSGLFGANAVRSPLSDVPTHKGRSAQQLEAVIDVALGPHTYDTAQHVLGALHPITPVDGFTAEVRVYPDDPHGADIRRVLNAGSSIGAVRRVDADGSPVPLYEVRSELFEYLSIVAKREFDKNKSHGDLAELERTISVALLPEVGANAELVLSHMHPIKEERGFMAEIHLHEIDPHHIKPVRSALNAGAIYERVQRAGHDSDHYFIHSDFFKTMIAIRGKLLMSGSAGPMIAAHRSATAAVEGGALGSTQGRIGQEVAGSQRQLTAPDAAGGSRPSVPAPVPDSDGGAALPEKQHRILVLHYRDSLIAAMMDIDGELARQRLQNEDVRGAAQQAWDALSKQGHANSRLGELIRQHTHMLDSKVANKHSELLHSIDGEQTHRAALFEASEGITEQFRTLAIFPESGLLDYLIAQLESAAGIDDGLRSEEQQLKEGLTRVRDEFLRSDLTSEGDWHKLAAAIRDLPIGTKVIKFKDGSDKNLRSIG